MPGDSNFGEWLACGDGRAHYFLGSRTLCGCRLPRTGTPVWGGSRRDPKIQVPHCDDCKRLNYLRWAERFDARGAA